MVLTLRTVNLCNYVSNTYTGINYEIFDICLKNTTDLLINMTTIRIKRTYQQIWVQKCVPPPQKCTEIYVAVVFSIDLELR